MGGEGKLEICADILRDSRQLDGCYNSSASANILRPKHVVAGYVLIFLETVGCFMGAK